MRNKIVLIAAIAGASLLVVAVVAAVGVFAVVNSAPVQAENVTIQAAPVQVAPVVEKVSVEKPALKVDRAHYAGKSGDCPFRAASHQQMVEAPAKQVEPAESQLLTLAAE